MIGPFERVGRVVTPTHGGYKVAGRALAVLAREGWTPSKMERGFTNDVLLAASCRESSYTLVTRNIRDVRRIAGALPGFEFVAAYPQRAER